jgi:hypothetical protein
LHGKMLTSLVLAIVISHKFECLIRDAYGWTDFELISYRYLSRHGANIRFENMY